MRAALATQDMGTVMRAFRAHPVHGVIISQEIAAGWVGLSQSGLSRIEKGGRSFTLAELTRWARLLGIPDYLRWFENPEASPVPGTVPDGREARWRPGGGLRGSWDPDECDDVHRRELLRLLSIAGTLAAVPGTIDAEWLGDATDTSSPLDALTLRELDTFDAHLWGLFGLAQSKGSVFELVREHLGVLTQHLGRPQTEATRRHLCALTASGFQLAGEVWFDRNRYTEAAHCYTVAATASREAGDFDLWACALTRHALVAVHEQEFGQAARVIDLASRIAKSGDSALSTRHWTAVVQAETFAGLGDLAACQRALDKAEEVHHLTGPIHNGGWLRFDGSRLHEERGTCYVALNRPDLADTPLTAALDHNLSARRRGAVLTDLALAGLQRRDVSRVITYGTAALDTARQTGSGYVSRRLVGLRGQLAPLLGSRDVRELHQQIGVLTREQGV